jgi:hypothetical protein
MMSYETRISKILTALEDYSKAYSKLEFIQKEEEKLTDRLLPTGDQKTGVFGEFYALQYLRAVHPEKQIRLSDNHSQKGYDIEVGDDIFVSVKTVSGYSKTRRTAPIKFVDNRVQQLHILSLDKQFKPDGYWIVIDVSKFINRGIKNLTIPKPTYTGFDKNVGSNIIADALRIIKF